jgi:signal peptide peptidase SppA
MIAAICGGALAGRPANRHVAGMTATRIFDRQPFAALRRRRPTVAVIRLYGVISPFGSPLRPALNLGGLAEPIERAFSIKGIKAVALAVNSPGGSPVQSALIHDRIRLLAAEKEVPVYVFCEDVAASGGYWIACAGDEIYANASSIVGSIGVISAGFGFKELIGKIGVERRLHTSGEKKSLLDPFLPEREEDVDRLKAVQREIHDGFKAHVRERRGSRLKAGEDELFSGEFWTGTKAMEFGLIDGIGDLKTVMRQKFGDKVRLRVSEPGRGWLRRRLGMGSLLAAGGLGPAAPSLLPEGWASSLVDAVEARALWSRYGQ